MSSETPSSRAEQAVRAAVEVLGEKGAAGLTHRAVDRHAGLPEGSTSNHFRTRGALVLAICQYLTEHDLRALDQASQRFRGDGELTPEAAAKRLVEIIQRWTNTEAVLTAARLELFLIAHRDPAVAAKLAAVRRTFAARSREWLEQMAPGSGEHTLTVMALVEGLTSNQLLHQSGRMPKREVEAAIRLVLESIKG